MVVRKVFMVLIQELILKTLYYIIVFFVLLSAKFIDFVTKLNIDYTSY